MCVFVRTITITFCLCASPKLFNSIEIPVQIDNIQEHEVGELFNLCHEFVNLRMLDGTLYTATDINQVRLSEPITRIDRLHKGTAMFQDYSIEVVNKTLVEICGHMTARTPFKEILLRIINIVESVGVSLLIKISLFARYIVGLSPTPPVLLTTILIPFLYKIDKKFFQLSIPRMPIERLKGIIQPFAELLIITPADVTIFRYQCTKFINTYKYLEEFVDIGGVNLINIRPRHNLVEDFLNAQLEFIKTNVDRYFAPIVPDNQ